jgi:transposase-like protein
MSYSQNYVATLSVFTCTDCKEKFQAEYAYPHPKTGADLCESCQIDAFTDNWNVED